MPAAAPTACRVAMMGRELADLHVAAEAAEAAEYAARRVANDDLTGREQHRGQIIDARRDGLEGLMTWHRAASLEGALHQTMIAIGDAGDLESFEHDEASQRNLGRRLRRLLFSIRGALEEAAGLKAQVSCGVFYGSDETDPLMSRSEVLA